MLIIREIPDTCLSIMWFRQRELCFFIAGRGCGAVAVAVWDGEVGWVAMPHLRDVREDVTTRERDVSEMSARCHVRIEEVMTRCVRHACSRDGRREAE